MTAKKLAW